MTTVNGRSALVGYVHNHGLVEVCLTHSGPQRLAPLDCASRPSDTIRWERSHTSEILDPEVSSCSSDYPSSAFVGQLCVDEAEGQSPAVTYLAPSVAIVAWTREGSIGIQKSTAAMPKDFDAVTAEDICGA